MADEVKKVPVEVDDEDLDLVAGGAYTQEQWDAMTLEERKAAQLRSIIALQNKQQCELA